MRITDTLILLGGYWCLQNASIPCERIADTGVVSEESCGSIFIDLAWQLHVEVDSWICMVFDYVQGGVYLLS